MGGSFSYHDEGQLFTARITFPVYHGLEKPANEEVYLTAAPGGMNTSDGNDSSANLHPYDHEQDEAVPDTALAMISRSRLRCEGVRVPMQPLRAPDRVLMETKQARRSAQSSEGAASVPEAGRGRPSSRRVTVSRARRAQKIGRAHV